MESSVGTYMHTLVQVWAPNRTLKSALFHESFGLNFCSERLGGGSADFSELSWNLLTGGGDALLVGNADQAVY